MHAAFLSLSLSRQSVWWPVCRCAAESAAASALGTASASAATASTASTTSAPTLAAPYLSLPLLLLLFSVLNRHLARLNSGANYVS